ncbi:MAG: PH domain-containing protein [Ruminococcus sp.]|jgi:hypothetical protein|nr:PH domain-containing protein [Ruminococcus sp.]
MIDFNTDTIFKLHPVKEEKFDKLLDEMLTDGEYIVEAFKTVRDGVVFTNKRIIAINVQGVTGKKKDYTTLPYSKIQAFSLETAGFVDIESELQLWFSGLGKVRFEFLIGSDVKTVFRTISSRVLEHC